MSRVRILNSDKEVTAVKFNLKEQRCLQKNLVTLDAEASYSVKLLDMENRGMKVFYRRFRDKVSKIRSHLKVNEISRLKDLELTGRLSPPINTANTTAALRIADAEKRLKIQGREHLRKPKSAITSKSLRGSRENTRSSLISGSFDSHLNKSSESIVFHRPSTIAWDDRLNASQDISVLRRQSKDDKPKQQISPSTNAPVQPLIDKLEEHNNRIPILIVDDVPEPEVPFIKPKVTGFSFVYGEEDSNPKSEKPFHSEVTTKPEPPNVMSISQNFIETGNVNSPMILHKTSESESSSECKGNQSNCGSESGDLPSDAKVDTDTKSDMKQDFNACTSVVSTKDLNKSVKSKSVTSNKPNTQSQNSHKCNKRSTSDTKKKTVSNSQSTKSVLRQNRNLPQTSSNSKPKKKESTEESKPDDTETTNINIEVDSQPEKVPIENEGKTVTVDDLKKVSDLAVPRATKSKSARYGSERTSKGDRTSRSVDGKKSLSASGRQSNMINLSKQYSCHNYDRDAMKMVSRMSFSISDGLFCLGDDPYEERRQLLLVDEQNRFIILLHKKEEYLKRIEEYIRKQLEETAHLRRAGSAKKKRSAKDVWEELKSCRYLRTEDGDENIDLSTVVTLASEQLKNKRNLTYKPLFKKQKSQKSLVTDDGDFQNISDTDSDGGSES